MTIARIAHAAALGGVSTLLAGSMNVASWATMVDDPGPQVEPSVEEGFAIDAHAAAALEGVPQDDAVEVFTDVDKFGEVVATLRLDYADRFADAWSTYHPQLNLHVLFVGEVPGDVEQRFVDAGLKVELLSGATFSERDLAHQVHQVHTAISANASNANLMTYASAAKGAVVAKVSRRSGLSAQSLRQALPQKMRANLIVRIVPGISRQEDDAMRAGARVVMEVGQETLLPSKVLGSSPEMSGFARTGRQQDEAARKSNIYRLIVL